MTFASKRNLCACTYHTLFSHRLTRLHTHTHTKQNLFKHVFLFLSCLQEFLLPPVLLMFQRYLIVEGVSYRSRADNTDGQCPSQGSCLGLRLNSPAQCDPGAFASGQPDKVFILFSCYRLTVKMFKTSGLTPYGATGVTGSYSSNSTNSLSAVGCVWSGLSPARIEWNLKNKP